MTKDFGESSHHIVATGRFQVVLTMYDCSQIPRTCRHSVHRRVLGTNLCGAVAYVNAGFNTTFAFLARGVYSVRHMNWILIKVFFGSSYLGFVSRA